MHQAQDFQEIQLDTAELTNQTWERAQSGDLNNDFVQDIVLSAGGGKAVRSIFMMAAHFKVGIV